MNAPTSSGQSVALGDALGLQRRLTGAPDRLALYAALTDNGTRRDTFLLERSTGPSLLMDQAALRIECFGHEVILTALSDNGRNVLEALERASPLMGEVGGGDGRAPLELTNAGAGGGITPTLPSPIKGEGVLRFTFPPSSAVDAHERLVAPSPFDILRALTTLVSQSPEEPFTIACLGCLAYDHVDLFEDLPANAEDPLGFPNFIFWLAESLIVFDPGAKPRAICTAFGSADPDQAQRAFFSASQRLADLVARCDKARDAKPLPAAAPRPIEAAPEVDLDDAAYGAVVSRIKEHIRAGDIYQAVPSRTFRAPCPDPIGTFAAIRALDPSPYQFFMAGPKHLLFGASPETSVRVLDRDGIRIVETKPIAGTRRRGATDDEDDRMEAEMRVDAKEAAEHMMLVDLARNDVARVSVAGTRRVEQLMTVERYARVMHLVSAVTGTIRPGLDTFHTLQACLNVGTLTGAPKIRATILLRDYEVTKRGPYGGAVGWFNGEGHLDTAVVIRSAVAVDGVAYVRAGAGIVYDSDPQFEADESRRKASALLSALAATGGESSSAISGEKDFATGGEQ